MTNSTRQSGLRLVVAGLLGGGFFYATDPRWTPFGRAIGGDNVVDAVHQLAPGTVVGLAGSGLVLMIGLWLTTRRTA